MTDPRTLAQSEDTMWERNLSIIASKNREVCVVTTFEDELIGYIAGLDKQFVQICLSDSATQVLINRVHLILVRETGKELWNISDESLRRKVEDRVKTFASVSKGFLTPKGGGPS